MDSAPNPDALTALLKPRNIALIGASERAPHAAALMHNLFRFGFPEGAHLPGQSALRETLRSAVLPFGGGGAG